MTGPKLCSGCSGTGTRTYGSTSTWRHGIGGQSITDDVCDQCWGTGNAARPGPNLRIFHAEQRALQLRLEAAEHECVVLRAKLEANNRIHALVLKERDAARACARAAQADRDDVWFWEGSKHDDPESLSYACPVVMEAETLQGILRAKEEAEKKVAAFVSTGALDPKNPKS